MTILVYDHISILLYCYIPKGAVDPTEVDHGVSEPPEEPSQRPASENSLGDKKAGASSAPRGVLLGELARPAKS